MYQIDREHVLKETAINIAACSWQLLLRQETTHFIFTHTHGSWYKIHMYRTICIFISEMWIDQFQWRRCTFVRSQSARAAKWISCILLYSCRMTKWQSKTVRTRVQESKRYIVYWIGYQRTLQNSLYDYDGHMPLFSCGHFCLISNMRTNTHTP